MNADDQKKPRTPKTRRQQGKSTRTPLTPTAPAQEDAKARADRNDTDAAQPALSSDQPTLDRHGADVEVGRWLSFTHTNHGRPQVLQGRVLTVGDGFANVETTGSQKFTVESNTATLLRDADTFKPGDAVLFPRALTKPDELSRGVVEQVGPDLPTVASSVRGDALTVRDDATGQTYHRMAGNCQHPEAASAEVTLAQPTEVEPVPDASPEVTVVKRSRRPERPTEAFPSTPPEHDEAHLANLHRGLVEAMDGAARRRAPDLRIDTRTWDTGEIVSIQGTITCVTDAMTDMTLLVEVWHEDGNMAIPSGAPRAACTPPAVALLPGDLVVLAELGVLGGVFAVLSAHEGVLQIERIDGNRAVRLQVSPDDVLVRRRLNPDNAVLDVRRLRVKPLSDATERGPEGAPAELPEGTPFLDAAPDEDASASVPTEGASTALERRFPIPAIDAPPIGIQLIPWNKLTNSDLNPRKAFDQVSLQELAVSIFHGGVKQNLLARPHPTRPGLFEIAAGERRWRAIGLLVHSLEVGEGERRDTMYVEPDYLVPVLVEDMTDLELLENATTENVQRRRMSPLEEADAFAALMEHGATVDMLSARFGYTKKTLTRRVQIARNLIPKYRALYDAGDLTLGQVEVLAVATPDAQQALYDAHLKYTHFQRDATPEALRKLLGDRLFQTARAQFPRHWYQGQIVPGDLFGDLPEHFADFKAALDCQVRHAKALADKDVSQGAPVADVVVRPELQSWDYDAGDGTLYWISNITGELKRYEGRRPARNARTPAYRAEAPRPVPTHETPAGPASAAPNTQPTSTPSNLATPDAPRYAGAYVVGVAAKAQVLQAALADDHLADVTMVWGHLTEEYIVEAYGQEALLRAVVVQTDGVLTLSEQDGLSIAQQDDGMIPGPVVFRALLALPADLMRRLARLVAIQAADLVSSLRGDWTFEDLRCALPGAPAWTLTEEYLQACNREALLELWSDAELPEEANASDQYLRVMLLEEAPQLAARGFLPRPMRENA